MADYLQVFTTMPSAGEAERIAGELLRQRLAACVQVVGPITSTYRWQGRVETAREWLCLAKTDRARYPRLLAAIEDTHPYDTPEIVAVPIVLGAERYLAWLGDALADDDRAAPE